MKFNLKNRPNIQKPASKDDYEKWFEGFEKELRENIKFEEEQAKKPDREQSMVAHFLIDLIKEILGA